MTGEEIFLYRSCKCFFAFEQIAASSRKDMFLVEEQGSVDDDEAEETIFGIRLPRCDVHPSRG